MTNQRMQSKEMFERVVANAVDFLKYSLTELEKTPKYSVIHFCSAIELFLKAKLMLEHWSLINEEPQKANITKFLSGNFKSVGIEETIFRLHNIVNVRVPKEAQHSFSELREHRNKMVHVFHADSKETTIQNVVIEQTKAWFYLHRLLTKDWKSDFDKYQVQIEELHRLVSNNQGYLKAKFDALLPDIEKGKERGVTFSRCGFCKFPALKEAPLVANLVTTDCLVCDWSSNKLSEVCPNCAGEIFIYDLGEAFCEDCDKSWELDYFVEKYAPIEYLGEGLTTENRAYCSYCEYVDEPSVVPFEDQWLCLCCRQLHDEITSCGWCNELIAGDMEDSYVYGCRVWCHGYLGYH